MQKKTLKLIIGAVLFVQTVMYTAVIGMLGLALYYLYVLFNLN